MSHVDSPPAERKYFCRHCQKERRARQVPVDWYNLSRMKFKGAAGHEWHRLGLYCSIRCLAAQIPDLEQLERTLRRGMNNRPHRLEDMP